MHEIIELTPNLEDYLEAVYKLEKERRVARIRDIAQLMNVSKPSVVAAMKKLGQKNDRV